ncbi:hypothetical protein [Pseudomonas japonica]|nr:hypothetical protein [Pseudomonas japonica]MBA1243856.1 hypothetical protein [Pseudomonas japonica]
MPLSSLDAQRLPRDGSFPVKPVHNAAPDVLEQQNRQGASPVRAAPADV